MFLLIRGMVIMLAIIFCRFAQAEPVGQQDMFTRQQQQQERLEQAMQSKVDVRLDANKTDKYDKPTTPLKPEYPCFAIDQIILSGEQSEDFKFALNDTLKQLKFESGMCLGAMGINQIMTLTQNKLIEKGYTTTRILAGAQNIKTGKLVLTVIPGKIHAIAYDQHEAKETHIHRLSSLGTQFPFKAGDVLNLREIEQGIENLKRNPTVAANIQIEPAQMPNESDVVVRWQQRTIPFRLSLSVDDSGSKITGKYQAGMTLAADNLLGLSDLFYANYNRDIGGKERLAGVNSGTYGYAFHYSVPFGKWLFSTNYSGYQYHQAVAGLNENYDYHGKSHQLDIKVSRLLQRSQRSKTYLQAGLWQRLSDNYINDARINVQRRRMAGWKIGLSHQQYIGRRVLNIDVGYKRGTGLWESLPAPEEVFGEGTSRMKILTLDVQWYQPFELGKERFSYEAYFHHQWNQTPLITQDRLSIGNRYTVRGFDGEVTLMGERGWYWQNTLNWQYQGEHQVYLGLDAGRVSGSWMSEQLGRYLMGTVLGFRGTLAWGGRLHYDVFVGKPLKRPRYFQTQSFSTGFSLSYEF
ncbi:hypothetical protein IX83_07865 [Basilea psittacipulmonis DSM 24701]|uniref:POTRA domain-containing protein n=2 Tax=Basilea TaxID=1472344 RepID=A0A077DEF9_9BURK|nr:hypothetical protein IX83_07865 [Basilea psittacipulmonis DSM 24701]